MNKLAISILVWLGLASAALAQGNVNTVPQVGVVSAVQKQYTYSAVSIGLVPAASGTDIFCIAGSASRAISIKQITISGVAGTLTSVPFTLLRRASLDTGGTAATGTALPVAAPNISSDAASVATLVAYTANPTIVDSSPTYFRSQYLTLPTAAAGTSIAPLVWSAGEAVGWFTKGLDIPKSTAGATQQYCININASTVTTGALNVAITWIEQ